MNSEKHESVWKRSTLALQYINGIEDAVFVADRELRIQDGNPAFFALLDIDQKQAIGRPLIEFIETESRLIPLLQFVKSMIDTNVSKRGFVTINDKENWPQSMLLTAVPLAGNKNEKLLAIRIEDISDMMTEKTEIEAEKIAIQERAEALAHLNEELEGFSYSVAHDLRAPLRFIDRFAYLLLEKHSAELSGEGLQYAEQIREGARQMAQLIEDLLEFSRATGQELTRQHFDLTDLAKEVIGHIEHDIEERKVEIELGELGQCYADRALLKQVLLNLIWNAVKFTRPREIAEIKVEHTRVDGHNTWSVTDNGVGFDSVAADRLYTVFQRFHQPEEFEGSGVGLAVVKRIIDRHGGTVWAESEVGHGAKFFFTLERTDQPYGEQ